MQRNLFSYIWRHSKPEQVVILSLVVLAQIFYFMSLTVPKSIVNNGISGIAFKNTPTIPFLVFEFDLSYFLPGKVVRLFDGFQVNQMTYLFVMSFIFLGAVVVNGQFKKSINTQKGRMGERMLRRLRYELYDRILRFPSAHFRKVKQAELATMVKDEVEPLGGFIGDAFVAPMFLGGQALTAIQQIFTQQNFNNIGYAFTGLAALQLSAGSASVLVFGLGVLVVYLVLSAQYESYVTPVIILMTVPLAMLGALVFLAIRSIDLNIYAQVGLVTLIGLAAKNGILIVEVAEQHMEAGMGATEAAIAAAESRMRPILMTAIASLAGFLPLVVATTAGANSQQSLGTVIFGGLMVATVLSLGVVPPFYVLIKGLEARWFPEPESDDLREA